MTALGLVFIFTYLGLTLCLTVLDLKNHKLKQRMKPQKDRHPGNMICVDIYASYEIKTLEKNKHRHPNAEHKNNMALCEP